MRQELDEKLCSDFPNLFVNRRKSMTETCMCWGFECGDGWYNILRSLCSNIQHHIDWSVKNYNSDTKYNEMIAAAMAGDITDLEKYYGGWPDADDRMKETLERGFRDVRPIVPQVTVDQVKEKFGTLRFYYTGGDDHINGMVRMAESMSGCTCEECGNPATTGGQGWIRTICAPCEVKREEARAAYAKQNGLEE